MTYIKKLLVIIILTICFVKSNAQTKFDNGYKDGFGKAYCYNQSIGCIPKAPTFAPIPRINESSSSYQNGYDRGYAEGLEYRRKEGQSNETNSQKNSPITFNPYVSQIPSNYYSAVEFKQKIFSERIDWVSSSIKNIISYIDTYIKPIDKEIGENLINENNNWVQSNLSFKKLDLTDEYIFSQVKNYFSNFNNKISTNYSNLTFEANNNSINFDDKFYQNIPNTIKSCFIYFYKNGKTEYEMNEREDNKNSEFTTIDKSNQPTFVHNFKVNYKGKDDTLYVLYFSKYDSYHFYLKSYLFSTTEMGAPKNRKDCTAFTFTTEYTQGGYGNPIYIKLSENNCMLYDKGNVLNCNYVGEVHYKINQYHNGIFKETYYDKKHCWQDKVSGKKYFLNNKSVADIPTCSDNLLVTNNKF